MDESVPTTLRPPQIGGDITVARYVERPGTHERWRVSIADRIHFLTDRATARRIHALAMSSGSEATYADAYALYKSEVGWSAEPLSPFVQWCETHRERLEQLADTPERLPIKFRYQLLSGATCQRIGKALAWLFQPSTMATVAGASLAIVLLNVVNLIAPKDASPLGATAIALLGVLFHEFGHISACVRHHAKQRGIGVGVYLIWPAFFSDVRGSWALNARARLDVSIGGLYFQSIYLAVLVMISAAMGNTTVTTAVYMTMLLMGNTLNPVLKFDGYWILSDWLNVTNLHTQIGTRLKALCHPGHVEWRGLVLSRMTLVAVAFTTFTTFFIWTVFRSLSAVGLSTIKAFPAALESAYSLCVAGDATLGAIASSLENVGSMALTLSLVAIGLVAFGFRAIQAMLEFASKTLGRK